MQEVIIADTSCLILLDKIDELSILQKLFNQVTITSIIAQEFTKPLPEWVRVEDAANEISLNVLKATVDAGEASALALALERPSLLILDDVKARKFAGQLNLKYTGTVGILIQAKLKGHYLSIRPIISKIRNTNFYLTRELEQKMLKVTGEL